MVRSGCGENCAPCPYYARGRQGIARFAALRFDSGGGEAGYSGRSGSRGGGRRKEGLGPGLDRVVFQERVVDLPRSRGGVQRLRDGRGVREGVVPQPDCLGDVVPHDREGLGVGFGAFGAP